MLQSLQILGKPGVFACMKIDVPPYFHDEWECEIDISQITQKEVELRTFCLIEVFLS